MMIWRRCAVWSGALLLVAPPAHAGPTLFEVGSPFSNTTELWQSTGSDKIREMTVFALDGRSLNWQIQPLVRSRSGLISRKGSIRLEPPGQCESIELVRPPYLETGVTGQFERHIDDWRIEMLPSDERRSPSFDSIVPAQVQSGGPFLSVEPREEFREPRCEMRSGWCHGVLSGINRIRRSIERLDQRCISSEEELRACEAWGRTYRDTWEERRAARDRAGSCVGVILAHYDVLVISSLVGDEWSRTELNGRDWGRTIAWTVPLFALDVVLLPIIALQWMFLGSLALIH